MSFKKGIIAQFRKPNGFWGGIAGTIMVHRPSNRLRNYWTVGLLDIQPDDMVLEVGFGPGLSIEQVCTKLVGGHVVGIDHSEAMFKQAMKRNGVSIKNGKARLIKGSLNELKQLKEKFNKAFAVNVWMFWDNPVENFIHIKSVLKENGKIAITYQPRKLNATNQDALDAGNQIMLQLQEAGFTYIKVEIKELKPVYAVCVTGKNN